MQVHVGLAGADLVLSTHMCIDTRCTALPLLAATPAGLPCPGRSAAERCCRHHVPDLRYGCGSFPLIVPWWFLN